MKPQTYAERYRIATEDRARLHAALKELGSGTWNDTWELKRAREAVYDGIGRLSKTIERCKRFIALESERAE